MAVAGLHNLSVFGPSLFWRDLEGDRVVSHSQRSRGERNLNNGSDSEGLSISISSPQRSDNGHDDICEDADETHSRGVTCSEMEHEDNNSVISEQSSDLGETERERVRQIFREWMNNNGAKGHSSNRLHLENGSVIAHSEINARIRPIRRLCGRQTLVDLLMRAQNERKEELQGLLEQRPVSDFPHRNRIQALLRGRFLRNERLLPEKGPSSVASTELGLLRQRHTVSGLRVGFLSKLDNSASTSGNIAEVDSSFNDINNSEVESTCRERETTGNLTASELENAESVIQDIQVEDPGLHEENEHEVSLDDEVNQHEISLDIDGGQQELSVVGGSESTEQDLSGTTHDEEINVVITNESSLETEDVNYGPHEVTYEHFGSTSGESYVDEEAGHNTSDLEGNENEQFDWRDASAQQDALQESVTEIEDWPSHDFQEAINSWLDVPSGELSSSVRSHTFYFHDDDSAHGMEIRELFSRRRVSSLLGSGFRESLDQVLQSHVERQGHASGDWELDNASSSHSLVEQDQNGEHASALSDAAYNRIPFAPTSTLVTASQPVWTDELQGANLPQISSDQQLGMEWELVNQLRIDMARLQQRMNNMQSMLEQCMDMQIELQRSVRQEVSAALNRSILTTDADACENTVHDESRWDCVRRGICCLCCDDNIDSLLYRCGHMCTCSKCAEKLVQGAGKCPMCQAPVVETVRAYFTH